jgi:NADPH:quinone reductase-like Zn-dependent oxidoreductase
VWPLLAAGRCRPLIDSTFPFAQAADAHRRIENADHVGKIVLTF